MQAGIDGELYAFLMFIDVNTCVSFGRLKTGTSEIGAPLEGPNAKSVKYANIFEVFLEV